MEKKKKLTLNEWYVVRVVLKGYTGANGIVMPRCEIRKKMQLIDVRSNGVLIMAEDRLSYDKPVGQAGRKIRRLTVWHKVRRADVLGTEAEWELGAKIKSRTGGLVLA
jgi:hypothetical protein